MQLIRLFLVLAVLTSGACSKNANIIKSASTDATGTWGLVEINSNQMWGGPFSWKTIDEDVKVQFTADGKYLRKEAGESTFKLVGDYVLKNDNKVELTIRATDGGSDSILTVDFILQDGTLILGTGRTETTIQEKFVKE
jgi:hypothetical protein